MNKLDIFLTKYFFYSIFLLIITAVLGNVKGEEHLASSSGVLRIVWDLLGWNIMVWIVCGLYIFLKMIVNANFRSLTLKKLIGTADRDERELLASGEAAKVSIISTSALTIFLLFLSLLNVSISKNTKQNNIKDAKGHMISIGMNSFEKVNNIAEQKTDHNSIFEYNGLPISLPIVLLLIISWQIFIFRSLTIRKLQI